MGILADFLIKHVRPVDDGWDLLTDDPGLRAALGGWGFSNLEIAQIFVEWRQIQDLKPDTQAHRQRFVGVARSISSARWDELYHTPKSTVMFLDAAQIKELSFAAGQHAITEHLEVWLTQPAMVAAVTIHRASDRGEFASPLPKGVEVISDAGGNASHFWKLL